MTPKELTHVTVAAVVARLAHTRAVQARSSHTITSPITALLLPRDSCSLLATVTTRPELVARTRASRRVESTMAVAQTGQRKRTLVARHACEATEAHALAVTTHALVGARCVGSTTHPFAVGTLEAKVAFAVFAANAIRSRLAIERSKRKKKPYHLPLTQRPAPLQSATSHWSMGTSHSLPCHLDSHAHLPASY
jgi:hypothetical protein